MRRLGKPRPRRAGQRRPRPHVCAARFGLSRPPSRRSPGGLRGRGLARAFPRALSGPPPRGAPGPLTAGPLRPSSPTRKTPGESAAAYLVLRPPLLVRLNWPLVATPRPDLAATAPSDPSGFRGHGGAAAASRSGAGKGAGEAEAAALEPPPAHPQPTSPSPRPTLEGTGTPGNARRRAERREKERGQQGRRRRRQRPSRWRRSGRQSQAPSSVCVTVSMEIPRGGQGERL